MARSMLENKDEYSGNEKNHPVDASDLLALIRKQRFENEALVRQHLTECAGCQQLYAGLAQTSKTLDVLNQVARYQRYPELSAAYLLKNGRQGYSQRRFSGRRAARYEYNTIRPRRSTLRLAMPVAMVIILVMAVIFIALARFGWNGSLSAPRGGTNVDQSGLSTGVAQQQVTPSHDPMSVGVATPGIKPSPDPTSTATPEGKTNRPHIYLCAIQDNASTYYLEICGRHFRPGDTVSLIVVFAFRPQAPTPTVQVSAEGTFDYRWFIPSCNSSPVSVYAKDNTGSPPEVSNVLYGLMVPGCDNPTPTGSSVRSN